MSEPLLLDRIRLSQSGPSAALTALAAGLAHRLAAVLAAHCSARVRWARGRPVPDQLGRLRRTGQHAALAGRPVTLHRLVERLRAQPGRV